MAMEKEQDGLSSSIKQEKPSANDHQQFIPEEATNRAFQTSACQEFMEEVNQGADFITQKLLVRSNAYTNVLYKGIKVIENFNWSITPDCSLEEQRVLRDFYVRINRLRESADEFEAEYEAAHNTE